MVRPAEAPALWWSGAYFFCILFAYYLISPYRDAMAIQGDIKKVPWLWTATTVAMLCAAPPFALMVSRLPRRRFVPLTYLFFAANLLVFYLLFLRLPGKTHLALGYTFFVWLSVFNLFMTSLFWGFMADIFTTEQAKRLFGAIGVGGTLGAIGGSSIPAMLVSGFTLGPVRVHLAAVHLLPISVAFLVLAVFCVQRLVRLAGLDRSGAGAAADSCSACRQPLAGVPVEGGFRTCPACGRREPAVRAPRPEPGRGMWTGFLLIARSPYLMTMCGYMLLFTVTSAFLAFAQYRIVQANYADKDLQVAFSGRINLFVNIVALTTQLFFTGRILTRLGLIVGLLVLPIVTALGFGALAWSSTPFMLGLVLVIRKGLHYAVDRPTREVLYTVLGPEEKYKSKSFIDTFVYRGGDVLGAWSDYALKELGIAVAGTAVVLSVVWAGTGVTLDVLNKRLARREPPAE